MTKGSAIEVYFKPQFPHPLLMNRNSQGEPIRPNTHMWRFEVPLIKTVRSHARPLLPVVSNGNNNDQTIEGEHILRGWTNKPRGGRQAHYLSPVPAILEEELPEYKTMCQLNQFWSPKQKTLGPHNRVWLFFFPLEVVHIVCVQGETVLVRHQLNAHRLTLVGLRRLYLKDLMS